jgi:hypothetical protein
MGNVMELVEVPAQTIEVSLEPEILRKLDDLVPEVASWKAVQEFGVKVTRETVARIAMLRGLNSMTPTPVGKARRPKASEETEVVSEEVKERVSTVDSNVTRDSSGYIIPPTGWSMWREGERIISSHRDLHDYYVRQGWHRYWGRSGDETINFYWSSDESLHDVEPFPGKSSTGKEVKVQNTPWGPGHIIPHGWE